MPRFAIDEDMPRSTGRILKEQGFTVNDVRDHGLRGADDEEIYQFAQKEQAVLLTADTGFGNILRFPLGEHCGIVLVRFPTEMSNIEMNRHVVEDLKHISENDYKGNLIILEPGRIRIRKKQ